MLEKMPLVYVIRGLPVNTHMRADGSDPSH